MSRASDDATARARLALVGMVCGLFALLLPSLLTAAPDASGVVALAALTLALAALVRLGAWCVLAGRTPATVPVARDEAPPVLRGRVTDPVHHPLRPRAPGRV